LAEVLNVPPAPTISLLPVDYAAAHAGGMPRWSNRTFPWALLLCLLAGGVTGRAQVNWRSFTREADDLAALNPTYLTFSPRGNLWVRHKDEPFLTRLNGYEAKTILGPTGAGASSLLAFRVYESVTGQLWMRHPEGVQWLEGANWVVGQVPEIRADLVANPLRVARPTPLLPAEYNRLFILLGDGLLKFDALTKQSYVVKDSGMVGLDRFSDMLPASEGGIWILAENGVARVPADKGRLDQVTVNTVWETYPLPEELGVRNPQRPFEDGRGGLLMLAERRADSSRVWLRLRAGEWSVNPLPWGARGAWETPDGRAWGLELFSLYQWEPPNLEARKVDDLGIQPYAFSDTAIEPGGAFWVSTADGVWRYAPASWIPPQGAPALNEAVHDVLEGGDGTLWFLGGRRLLRRRSDQWHEFEFTPVVGQPEARAGALGQLADGRLFFPDDRGLVAFDTAAGEFSRLAVPGEVKLRYAGPAPDGHLFIQPATADAAQRMLQFDGVEWKPPAFAQPPGTIGDWTTALVTDSGEVWVGGSEGAARFADDEWTDFTILGGFFQAGVDALFDRGKGVIWAITRGKLFTFSASTWVEQPTGLDRLTGFTTTDDGVVWLATEGGLLRRYETQWVSLGAEEGVPGGVQVLRQSSDGQLWLGHARGLSVFRPEADKDPPQTYLDDTPRSAVEFGSESPISFAFSGRDRWKTTPASGPRVSLPIGGFQPGAYKFEVRAMDRNFNVDPVPAAWAFTVVVPWFKQPRILGIVLLAGAAVLGFAALAVNRHLRLVRSYAEIERIVAERTHQLDVANRELAHSEKMRSLGTLAAGVAHEFNSILSIIRGSVQIIEAHPQNEEKVRTRISRIKSMVEQGSTLVKAMLGFSRADDAALVLDNVGEVVEDVVRLLGDRLPPEVEVRVDIAPGLPSVRGTRELLQQMLLNLILNALDAMESRGRLVVHCQRLHQVPEHWVLAPAAAGEYLSVSVEDSGSGISPENLSRIFEPFFTTKAFSTRHGTGLGLSMVYEYCKELGYGLQVRSELRRGTAFSIVIPVFRPSGAMLGNQAITPG
jgi:signal transduction histidine kinase/ligand-binding sensor domain-containing protein